MILHILFVCSDYCIFPGVVSCPPKEIYSPVGEHPHLVSQKHHQERLRSLLPHEFTKPVIEHIHAEGPVHERHDLAVVIVERVEFSSDWQEVHNFPSFYHNGEGKRESDNRGDGSGDGGSESGGHVSPAVHETEHIPDEVVVSERDSGQHNVTYKQRRSILEQVIYSIFSWNFPQGIEDTRVPSPQLLWECQVRLVGVVRHRHSCSQRCRKHRYQYQSRHSCQERVVESTVNIVPTAVDPPKHSQFRCYAQRTKRNAVVERISQPELVVVERPDQVEHFDTLFGVCWRLVNAKDGLSGLPEIIEKRLSNGGEVSDDETPGEVPAESGVGRRGEGIEVAVVVVGRPPVLDIVELEKHYIIMTQNGKSVPRSLAIYQLHLRRVQYPPFGLAGQLLRRLRLFSRLVPPPLLSRRPLRWAFCQQTRQLFLRWSSQGSRGLIFGLRVCYGRLYLLQKSTLGLSRSASLLTYLLCSFDLFEIFDQFKRSRCQGFQGLRYSAESLAALGSFSRQFMQMPIRAWEGSMFSQSSPLRMCWTAPSLKIHATVRESGLRSCLMSQIIQIASCGETNGKLVRQSFPSIKGISKVSVKADATFELSCSSSQINRIDTFRRVGCWSLMFDIIL